MLNGEVISPPAVPSAQGMRSCCASQRRTGATVLSNALVQEFTRTPWLFDDLGRLIGGKPVPAWGGSSPRLPSADPEPGGDGRASEEGPRVRAGEGAGWQAAQKAARRQGPGATKKASRSTPRGLSHCSTPGRAKVNPGSQRSTRRSKKRCTATTPRAGCRQAHCSQEGAPPRSARAKTDTASGHAAMSRGSRPGPGSPAGQGPDQSQRKRSVPPPAVNEPLTFINFVAAFAVGSTLEGEVVSFTSHGAMVDVPLPGGGALHCYIPLTAMGSPPPTKARQVLKKGEVRPFVLAGLDPPRRVAELALPSRAVAPTPGRQRPWPPTGAHGELPRRPRGRREGGVAKRRATKKAMPRRRRRRRRPR